MGVFDNILNRTQGHFGRHGLASILVGVVLIALIGAASSFAETGEGVPESSVSTSPTDLAKRDSVDAKPRAALSTDGPPLTRAASKLRIDEMSPTRWLSRFGRVSIDHRE